MPCPGRLLPGLIASVISLFLLPCDTNGFAALRGDELMMAGPHQGSDHPELSLSTGLWRSEFLDAPEMTPTPNQLGQNEGQKPVGLPAAVRNTTRELAAVRLDQEFMDGTGLVSEPPSDSAIEDPMAFGAISDWEHAACLAAGSKKFGATHPGPSVISLIVGVVGLVVVVGAYFNSARNSVTAR